MLLTPISLTSGLSPDPLTCLKPFSLNPSFPICK